MKVKLYAIRDDVAGLFHAPMVAVNAETMKRQLQIQHAEASGTIVSQYPYDYSLYKVGVYDDSNGCITEVMPTVVCGLFRILRPEKESEGSVEPA